MSILYSMLKPVVRRLVKGKTHKEENYEDFVRVSHEAQAKFKLKLPQKKGYVFREESIGGCRCIVGGREGHSHSRALLYLVGGGERRWQMPMERSMLRYIDETDRELWLPLYPLYPEHNIVEAVQTILEVYKRMLQAYAPEDIAWLGFSAGADLIMASGKHLVKEGNPLPMPGLMLPVSCCNLRITDESYARMQEIEKRDIMLFAASVKAMLPFYDPEDNIPHYYWGDAAKDDYTGFPKIVMYFGGDEIFAAEAPEYEKAFQRCGVKDYIVHVEPGLFHAYPMFPFVKEGKKGEDELINYLK